LFNYLFARHHGGTFILRIEDTDRSRFQQDALTDIFGSLRWLGLEWEEGPEAGGTRGPYFQSERTDLYREHAEGLIAQGHAYRCFCTPERLRALREEQEKSGQAQVSGYDRHCRGLSQQEIQRHQQAGSPCVIRLKIPLGRTIAFEDMIRGRIEYQSDVLDDLVLLKSDGFPTYHLANIVDDHHMGITHVMRGEEWIASTPRHILLYEAFGWQPPHFAHLPVILSPQGGKLSKRKGAVSVLDYRRAGYLPEALFNFLALLGWAPGDDREKMIREEIIESFTLEKVSPKAAVLDEKKLEWMNGLYMQERSVDSLFDTVVDLWHAKGLGRVEAEYDESYLRRVIGLMKGRSKRIQDLAETSKYFFEDPTEYEEKAAKKHFKGDARQVLQELVERLSKMDSFDEQALEDVFRQYAESEQVSAGKLIHPTRLAVSGVSFGPGLFEMLETLGKDRVLRRMKKAVEKLGG
jgi:glutamyl-tRNA synthetase